MFIDLAEHLRDSALGTFLDFSSAIVITQLYLEIFCEVNKFECSVLRGCLEKFSQSVRLTSGHGMLDIWKGLACHCALAVESTRELLSSDGLPLPGLNLATLGIYMLIPSSNEDLTSFSR